MPKPNAATFLTTLLALFVLWRSRRWALPTWILTFGLPSLLYALFGGRTFAFRIRGKTVLVTGASSGLGKAIAIVAAKRGAKAVVIAARRKEKLQSTAKAVEALGARAVILELDITDFEAVEAACERTEKELGAIGLLVNNAGSGAWKHVEETTAEEAAKMMACPYNGAFACTTAFVKSMVEAKEGHVLNVTSAASHGGIRGAVGYATARWAMRGFSRNLQQDLRELGIGVTLLNAAEIVGTE
uniref:Ketoreductase domain-containing protein n=1 Tax=Lotharella oceanica TaxID=641309 RepID=A0A7S2TZK3_9EUKA